MTARKSGRYKMCPLCEELRPLPSHLHEAALAAEYLGNRADFSDGESIRKVSTETISDWLKLASQLQKVDVDTWRFSNDDSAIYCDVAAEQLSSDATHFSTYATALTRFLFVANALEETYRFVDGRYDKLAEANNLPDRTRVRSTSIRASLLLDLIPSGSWPKHLSHVSNNYSKMVDSYLARNSADLSGMQFATDGKPAYALHLVRNIRNHVSHGIFPLTPNPEYGGEEGHTEDLIQLLNQSCRVSGLAIQMLLQRFSSGFESYEYLQCVGANGPEFDYFIEHCDLEYLGKLHLVGRFSISNAFDYGSSSWEEEPEDNM